MTIDRWFQGSAGCGGYQAEMVAEPSGEKFVMPQCLWTQSAMDGLTMSQIQQLADVADRLFSSRCMCGGGRFSPITKLIHTNNHPETTREDIDKILRVFTEEMETK